MLWIAYKTLMPNATTAEAVEAARRRELVEAGMPPEALAELNRKAHWLERW